MEGGLLGLIRQQEQSAQTTAIADGLLLLAKQQQQHSSGRTGIAAVASSPQPAQHDQLRSLPNTVAYHSQRHPEGAAVGPSTAPPFLDFSRAALGAAQATQTPAVPPVTIFDDLRGHRATGRALHDGDVAGGAQQQSTDAALLQALARLLAQPQDFDPQVHMLP